MRARLTFLLALLTYAWAFSQTARVQIIHNSPSPTVDIYANDDLLLDNFVFRTATPFIDVPAGVGIDIGVALSNSTSSADAIANFPVQFADGGTYVVVAGGVVGGAQPFNLFVFDMGQETVGADNVGILFFHGSPDAPAVDIVTGGSPIFDDVSFGNFAGYLEVPAASYTLGVTPANDNSNVLVTYEANLGFWRGRTVTVFASGFLTGGNPSFEPWVALSNGGTFPLSAVAPPPPPPAMDARVQIIHNSPDPGATVVDIYANDDLLLDNFSFREATPFVEVPVGVTVNIGVAPSNSNSSADAIATFPVVFEGGKRYIAVANGLLPDFGIDIFDMGRMAGASAANFDLAVHHGSPNAPAVDIAARGIGTVVPGIAFREFADYLSLPGDTYYLDIKPAGSPDIVATFEADVNGLEGMAGIALASGQLGGDPSFTVIVVLADGTVVELPTASIARVQVIHNSPTPTVDVWANADRLIDNFAFRTATPYITVPAGVDIDLGIALADSDEASDAIATFPVNLENGKTYVVVATGIVGGTPGFNLAIFDQGQERADAPENVGILFFHGSPDAPEVDIVAGGSPIFDNVSYGNFAGYLNVPAGSYELDVTPADDNSTVVQTYDAPLGFWKGRTAVVFASGFLGGGSPGFEPWVALDNGGTFPLPVADNFGGNGGSSSLLAFGNDDTAEDFSAEIFPNPASSVLNVKVSGMSENSAQLLVVNLSGQVLFQRDLSENTGGVQTVNIDLATFQSGTYFLRLENGNHTESLPFQVVR